MPSLPISPDSPIPTKNKHKKSESETPKTLDSSKKKSSESKEKKKRDKKKRKIDDGVDDSLMNKKAKLMQLGDDEEEEEGGEEGDVNALSKFRISKPLQEALISKGIKGLFPIQAMTFDVVLDGGDLVGRARTGQGKTLAFVLPILESLVNGLTKDLRKTGYGKSPSVLVLLPTRELATQVFADFQFYGGSLGLLSCCVYGGAPIYPQINSVKKGVDVVIGTPGRVKDLLERGALNLGSLLFRVLDEADEMLRMGFVDDVELILGKVDDVTKVQTLLFSATLPVWVKQISTKFLKSDKKTVDLVSDQKMKASTNVRHIAISCSVAARPQLIPDIIRCYSSGGRTIIFAETRDSTSQLASMLPGARPLHGDINQSQREVN